MEDAFPTSLSPNKKTNDVNYHILNVNCKDKAYTDLTGQFTYRSSRGKKYIFIVYHYDANAILETPIKNIKTETIIAAWKQQSTRFKEAGVESNIYVMDNEASNDLKDTFKGADIEYQIMPPHNHRTNLSDCAIHTFKGHFKARLVSLDPDFPISEWDRIVEQGELALNILRASR